MKLLRPVLLGIAPGAVGALGRLFMPSLLGDVQLGLVYVFGVACCFRGGFGIADQCVRSPGKNLLLGFLLTAVFFAINLGGLFATAAYRSKSYIEHHPWNQDGN